MHEDRIGNEDLPVGKGIERHGVLLWPYWPFVAALVAIMSADCQFQATGHRGAVQCRDGRLGKARSLPYTSVAKSRKSRSPCAFSWFPNTSDFIMEQFLMFFIM